MLVSQGPASYLNRRDTISIVGSEKRSYRCCQVMVHWSLRLRNDPSGIRIRIVH